MSRLLDTSVVSAIMRRDEAALTRLRPLHPTSLALSTPVAAEISFGLSRLVPESRRRHLLETEYRSLRRVLTWVDWTEGAARAFGEIKAELQRQGTPIQDMDVAIGSIAITLGARVATLNVRHFDRISGLIVEDWTP